MTIDHAPVDATVRDAWSNGIVDTLHDYIAIPNVSEAYDSEWEANGHMDRAVALIHDWCVARDIDGLTLSVERIPGRSPLIVGEIPATDASLADDTVVLYGHLDKQPEMTGWRDGFGPWTPVLEDGRLYGRGGADDGYATFASLNAVEALRAADGRHARLLLLVEASEESGSPDLPAHLDALGDRLGNVSLVIALDSSCATYDRLWVTTSLRGNMIGNLSVDVLTEGVHSGAVGGVVPSSFRILRRLLDRIEDADTGRVLVDELWCDIPDERLRQLAEVADQIMGNAAYPFAGDTKPDNRGSALDLLRAKTWEPSMANVGIDGFPPTDRAGNVLRPNSTLKLSFRLAPDADAGAAAAAVKAVLEAEPPNGATVRFDVYGAEPGWSAPPTDAWMADAVQRASTLAWGAPPASLGEGGTIPFMRMLGERFPDAQFLITGVLGPGSNAHGPNEFLDIATAERVTMAVAHVLDVHAVTVTVDAHALAEGLPIRGGIDRIVSTLGSGTRLVLEAPPGAGKTTIVPLVLLAQPWCTGTVVVLEPRRLAVRGAARRMAQLLGERPGQRVGWRMRSDTKVSPQTRVEVVTEGVLTRRLQRDPELEGVSAVVFDEFHERSIDADLGLALTLDAADALRDDLRIVVMSATLDAAPVADLLDAPRVQVEGRQYPIETINIDHDERRERREMAAARAAHRALRESDGDVLVFLPGAAEIRRTADTLAPMVEADVDVRMLYGALPPADQDAAIEPSPPGRRKVVLATSIAETSLTIEGVTAVVDAGLRRAPQFDTGTSMTRLVTLPVTVAEAEQRRGRAGRLGPGRCYRLWPTSADVGRRPHPEPEITVADLTSLALDVANWGARPDDLRWLDRPPARAYETATDTLQLLGALDDDLRITEHGRQLSGLPLHPRHGHLVIVGKDLGHGPLAAEIGALLAEGDVLRGDRRPVGIDARRRAIHAGPTSASRAAVTRVRADTKRLRRLAGIDGRVGDDSAVGLLVGLAFPDRIGVRRSRGEFSLSGGGRAFCEPTDALADEPFVAVAALDGDIRRSRMFLAAPLAVDDIRAIAGERVEIEDEVGWDDAADRLVARRVERFLAIVLGEAPLPDPPTEAVVDGLLAGIRAKGAHALPWTKESRRLRDRLQFLHRHHPDRYPAVDDDALLADLEHRIAPLLVGARRWRDVERVDIREVLLAGLDWKARSAIDELAPERIAVPSGNRHTVDYGVDPPVLAVKLQELFGATATPTVGGVPVVVHLLSPAGRPVQVTQDLASFWANGYTAVRADLRGRYPKHPWPEDPTTATATARTNRRLRREN